MSIIVNTISDDIGSFGLSMNYIVIGMGMQRQETKTCIAVLETKQEKYRELTGAELLTAAENLVRIDLDPLFNGPYKVAVTSFGLLPDKTNAVYEVFVFAIGFTPNHKIMTSKVSITFSNTSWKQELDRLTEDIYNELLADMSIVDTVSEDDMMYFGVDFTCFNILRRVN